MGRVDLAVQRRLMSNGLVFTSNKHILNKGNYFYGYSHTPIYDLKLPRDTYLTTCFRDPVKRVISLYNMLSQIKRINPEHPLAVSEGRWLGESIEDFLENAPRSLILNQLYMFSKDFDVNEAISRVSNVNLVIFTEDFNNGVIKLNKELGVELETVHIRRTTYKGEQSYNMENIKKTLKLEYDFLDKVKLLEKC